MILAAHSIRNRALVNAVVVLILAVGIYALVTMPRELNPQVSFNWAFITTFYPGASPEEVERLVTIPIEDEIAAVQDVDVVVSDSEQGRSFIWVKFDQIPEDEFQRRLEDVRTKVAKAELPDEADDQEVREFDSYDFQPVVSVAISGAADERALHEVSRELEEDLKRIDGIGRVEAFGDRDRAVLVDCDPHLLVANGLDIVDVEDALRLADRNLPAGVLKLDEQQILLRTEGKVRGAEDVAAVTLRAGGEGQRLRVADVATVTESFKEQELLSRFNGRRAVAISLTKNARGNTVEIVDDVKALLDDWRRRLPADVRVDAYNDESLMIIDILSVLQGNAILGLVLVILGLMLFVGWRAALCAALGIPVTFLLAIIALDWSGDSLNGSTLFGLILVLGMVVDDAIVILENAYRHLQTGKSLAQAAVDGVKEVATPVTISTLTTLAGFLPLVLMPGTMGKFMRIIPITVALVLVASLIEAFWILPSHFVEIVRLKKGHRGESSRLVRWQDLIERVLRAMLRRRYATAIACGLILCASVALIPLVGVQLFAADQLSRVGIMVDMPDGTRLEETERVVKLFEEVALGLPEDELEGVMANAGLQQTDDDWLSAPFIGQVWADVVEAKERDRTIDQIVEDLRRRSSGITGPAKVTFMTLDGGPPAEEPIELLIKGPTRTVIEEVSGLIQDELNRLPGVFDVKDDVSMLQPKLDVVVDREAAARRGLDANRIARSVRAAFAGSTAATYRDANEELDVVVRLEERARTDLEDVSSLRLVTANGAVVPLSDVANVVEGASPQSLERHDRQQAVTVTANVDEQQGGDLRAANIHIREYFERIRSAYPSVRLEEGGQFREFSEAFRSLVSLFAFGIMLNFMLLTAQFKNWTQPFVILAVIPLSFIGAMLGLLVSGDPFSITTLYGFVALAGIAVNDSIVLVAFINKLRNQGYDRWSSLTEAARLRLRPILLTSITTIFGLMPMALGLGGTSRTWAPLAITIAGGLSVATVICLLVIPCLHAILDDLLDWLARIFGRTAVHDSDQPPADPDELEEVGGVTQPVARQPQ